MKKKRIRGYQTHPSDLEDVQEEGKSETGLYQDGNTKYCAIIEVKHLELIQISVC